jgi:hypothetical protein
MLEARRVVRLQFGRDHHPVLRKIAQVLATIGWPAAVLVHLRLVRRWFGPPQIFIKRIPGALWAAIRHNISPSEYYQYELWRPDHRKNVDNYLYLKEGPQLFKVLNRQSRVDPIDDKLVFYKLCKSHDIPTPEVLAQFAPTCRSMDFRSGLPPHRDLFVKPRTGSVALSHERFRWDRVIFQSNRGGWLRPEDLAGYLENRARTEHLTLLVQPALANHPELRTEPDEALATARLVTGRSIQGEITPIFAFMSFGLPHHITAHSNWITLIDVANGRLMPEPPQNHLFYQYRQFDSNEDCVLPDWDAALRHVKAAHNACSNFVFIGWDVAFTANGVMVLEGNCDWSAQAYQSLRGEPLGLTKFGDILATQLSHLEKYPKE